MDDILHENLLNGRIKVTIFALSWICADFMLITMFFYEGTVFYHQYVLLIPMIPPPIVGSLPLYLHYKKIDKGKLIEKQKGKLIFEKKYKTMNNYIDSIVLGFLLFSMICGEIFLILFIQGMEGLIASFLTIGAIGVISTYLWINIWSYLWIYENGFGYPVFSYELFIFYNDIEKIELRKDTLKFILKDGHFRFITVQKSDLDTVIMNLKKFIGSRWNNIYFEIKK